MAANNNLGVKLISECFIKPKSKIQESKTPHYLLGEDLKWLSIRYIQTGFLFNKPTTFDFNINSFVEKMKHSLSHALVYYYPLAGRLTTVKYEDEHACSIHVDCDKGPGARFIHASCVHVTGSDIVDHTAYMLPLIQSFFDLGETAGVVNYDGHTRALVSLQVTELKDGVFVGVTMNHSVADGTSFMNFVGSLSEIFRLENDGKSNISLSHVPIFKPFLVDGCNLIQKLPFLEPNKFISREDNDLRLREKIFHFSSSSIAKLKRRANSECVDGHGKISSFQALAAFVWLSINRARKMPAQAITVCIIPVDCRARFSPPLSPAQFGNLAQVLAVTKKVGELLENGPGWASMVLHQGIASYDHQVATQYMKAIMENPFVVRLDDRKEENDKINLVNFAWASRFDMYGVDFGLGKAVATPSGDNDKRDGMVIVKAGREGGGSMDIEVSLLSENMVALESDQELMAFVSSF